MSAQIIVKIFMDLPEVFVELFPILFCLLIRFDPVKRRDEKTNADKMKNSNVR